MTIKMIAMDLDGTLLRKDKTIDPVTMSHPHIGQRSGQERMFICL